MANNIPKCLVSNTKRTTFVLEITTQSTCDFTKEEWEDKVRKEKRLNQTNMKLFYVDQFNKVQEFNGTDEEKQALIDAGNLYHDEWHAYLAIEGKKTRYVSSYIFRSDILDKYTLSRFLSPISVSQMHHIEESSRATFTLMRRRNLLFDTFEEAEAMSKKLIAVLRGEAAHHASTPKQSQAPQDGQRQPCDSEQQSQDESSCGRTTSNSGCKCHEQDHSSGQGSVKVTVIEMFL